MESNAENKIIYLTLDLEQDYGTALHQNYYDSLANADQLISFLNDYNIPITVFIQTKLIEENRIPKCFKSSKNFIEFQPHSYSHLLRENTNMVEEIRRSTNIFKNYFKMSPTGYRFPDGIIQIEDYKILSQEKYLYDASIFPSWRPGRFNNSQARRVPFLTETGIIEIPFTVLGKKYPIPISLSYLKLLGKIFLKKILKKQPENIVFDFHLHDFEPPKKAYSSLPLFYKIIYRRNFKRGFKIFKNFVLETLKKGYKFDILSNYEKKLRKSLSGIN